MNGQVIDYRAIRKTLSTRPAKEYDKHLHLYIRLGKWAKVDERRESDARR